MTRLDDRWSVVRIRAMIPTRVENGKGRDMGKALSGRVVATVVCFTIVALLAGCDEPPTRKERQARLLAAENMQLKERLKRQQSRMEAQQKRDAERMQRQEQDLARSRARAEQLQKDLNKHVDERVRDVTTEVMNENARLRRETERLEAEIKELESESKRP